MRALCVCLRCYLLFVCLLVSGCFVPVAFVFVLWRLLVWFELCGVWVLSGCFVVFILVCFLLCDF